jgi:hypothetical protein
MRFLSTISLLLAGVLFAAAPAVAQDSHGRSRVPPSTSSGGSSGGGGGRQAVPRDSSPPPPPAAEPAPSPRSQPSSRSPSGAERRAVPRTGPPPRSRDGGRVYRPYPYYPYYPYGYGAFGLGYFYYDPFWGPYGTGYPGYAYPYPGYGVGFDTGEVRLKVKPRDAEVFVNGYYAGRVDEFDGIFQALKLQEGNYHLSITAPGYEPLEFDVHVSVDHKTTYEGELLRRRP